MKTAETQSHDYLGRGVARIDNKVCFIEGALADETVGYEIIEDKKRFSIAKAVSIQKASEERVTPQCVYYKYCGGCNLQHLSAKGQDSFKKEIWLDQLQRFADLQPKKINAAIEGDAWHYRTRARLSVVYSEDGISVGYRSRQSHQIAAADHCVILDDSLSRIIKLLPEILKKLPEHSIREVTLHKGASINAMNLITSKAHKIANIDELDVAIPTGWQLWVDNRKVSEDADSLNYEISSKELLNFKPNDFLQSNLSVNEKMVATVITLLKEWRARNVIDFFSGLGNFSLAAASHGFNVQAFEGNAQMVKQLNHSAEQLNLIEKVKAKQADLFQQDIKQLRTMNADTWLVDPPRAGAQLLLTNVPKQVKNIVYISCNPATLARDAKQLSEQGFSLPEAGLIDMFPQTTHIESINCFRR